MKVTPCARRSAPTGCKDSGGESGGVVPPVLRPRLTMPCPFGVVCARLFANGYFSPAILYIFSPVPHIPSPVFYILSSVPHIPSPVLYILSSVPHIPSPVPHIPTLLAHLCSPKGRSMVNPGRSSSATPPGAAPKHRTCTPKGRSGGRTSHPPTPIPPTSPSIPHIPTFFAHLCSPKGRSMVNPGRSSSATTPGAAPKLRTCTPKGRSGGRTSHHHDTKLLPHSPIPDIAKSALRKVFSYALTSFRTPDSKKTKG